MDSYDYPPSQHLLDVAQIDKASHYYVRGIGHFDSGDIECEFEVAYSHECQVIIICYFNQESFKTVFLSDGKQRDDIIRCQGFEGMDVRSRGKITVNNPVLTTMPYSPSSFGILVASSFKWEYERLQELGRVTSWQFFVTGVDKFLTGQRFAGIVSDIQRDATINPIRNYDEREYDAQPTAELVIPPTCIPEGWNVEAIVDLWCAVISLSTGKDVQWTTKCELSATLLPVEQTWQKRTIIGRWRHDGYFPVGRITIIAFTTQLFSQVFNGKVTSEESRWCVDAIRHYVFSLLATHVAENQGRLIASYIDATLLQWEKKNNPGKTMMKESEANRLTALLVETARTNASSFLDDLSDDSISQQRLSVIIEKIEKDFRKTVRDKSFNQRLTEFFTINKQKHQASTSLQLPFPEETLRTFKKTRDKIVHEGTFSKKELDDMQAEYRNMLVVIPLMVLSVFGYDGPYDSPTEAQSHPTA